MILFIKLFRLRLVNTIFLCSAILLTSEWTAAQAPIPLPADTNKVIEIISAESLRQITINDSTVLETLAGHAAVRQGQTILKGDSIVLNKRLGTAEVFGNVHINDADTVNTYAQYLQYVGNEQIAYLKKKVKLTDGKAQLFTDNLVYNLKTGVATYADGGKVINGKTVLTSKDAIYYSDTKDVFFQKNVHLVDPKYDMVADSLRYNTAFKNAYFIAPTHIVSPDGIIDTQSGTYNMETGEAVFLDRTVIKDSTRNISGNKIALEQNTGIVQIEGNGKFVDSSNNVIVLGNQILIDKKNSTFLASRKPIMILYQKNDSTYIAADTLFSGRRIKTASNKTVQDTLQKTTAIQAKASASDSIRYFIGFHHVRIFNDSLQASSDSLHYSTEDSTFKLFQHPLAWNDSTQISGDTMYLFTQQQKAKELAVFNNSMVINKTAQGFYNQIGGRTLRGYFKEGKIDYIRIKGSPAESVYYPQDADSAYIGMDRSKGDVIDVFFKEQSLYKIKFINDVSGTLFPMSQIPAAQQYLKHFLWEPDRRPRTKIELFE